MQRPTLVAALHELPAFDVDGHVRVVVECPRGASVKLKHEPDLDVIAFGRPLPAGIVFPHDFGFVPSTRAPDGDPLDGMVLGSSTYPGVVIACRPVCVLRASQRHPSSSKRIRNDRVVLVAAKDGRADRMRGLSDLAPRLRDELAAFFVAAVALEEKHLRLLGWGGAREALALVRRASSRCDTNAPSALR